jgi:hypothetical protein
MIRILAAVLLTLFSCGSALAADIQVRRPTCSQPCEGADIYIIGQINPGDAERFKQVLKAAGPTASLLYLRSPGGNMYESIEIGTIVKKLMLVTMAPIKEIGCSEDATRGIYNAPCTCLSGCFLIWLGGIARTGNAVGMHRPWDTAHNMGKLTYDQAAPIYAKWLADLKEYLRVVETPETVYSRYIQLVNSDTMHMLSTEEALELLNMPSVTEWLINRCGSVTNDEAASLINSGRVQQLRDKQTRVAQCEWTAKRNTREAIFKAGF